MLDEIVRDDARQMLAAALQAEVARPHRRPLPPVDAHGRRLVVRDGHHSPREVLTAAGALEVTAPRVNDKRIIDADTGERQRFSSAILPAWTQNTVTTWSRPEPKPSTGYTVLLTYLTPAGAPRGLTADRAADILLRPGELSAKTLRGLAADLLGRDPCTRSPHHPKRPPISPPPWIHRAAP